MKTLSAAALDWLYIFYSDHLKEAVGSIMHNKGNSKHLICLINRILFDSFLLSRAILKLFIDHTKIALKINRTKK